MPESLQSPSMEISNGIAQLYKERYLRGPVSLVVHLLPDSVVCLLRDVNAPVQAALVRDGEVDLAQSVHEKLQMGMAREMAEVVERATGRSVGGYVPGFNARIAATTDVFLLEPEGA